ncbi:MAG: SpoIVB peptidase [Oscillospiraceae bacterium]|jgi:stage IV sporulation protein B|nr:SpoIVB peptidase [Oscillospiraceae bacterium]
MRKFIKGINALAALSIFNIWALTGYYTAKLPDSYYVNQGEPLSINAAAFVQAERKPAVLEDSAESVSLKLFGIIPIKDVTVEPVKTPVLVPGGTPFGIKLLMDGVMVVEIGEVDSGDSPAMSAGLRKGDIIQSVNGKKVSSNAGLQKCIANCDGKPVDLCIKRDEKIISVSLMPVYNEQANAYQAGVWVRDSTAGMGTMTFYDPETNEFGGLGHPICDVDTGEIIPIANGEIVDVQINGVKKGVSGIPGELQGNFIPSGSTGVLESNNECGVFGKLLKKTDSSKAIPMALKQEAKLGDAVILSTINGTTPKEYQISIRKIDFGGDDSARNMIIKITDPELLNKTGGIVQGMSGSPIIQNGKIIGAVTHVLVNDPTSGYGIFCENMYEMIDG